jgi:uncharacterized membrane-anchored protein
MQTRHVPAIDRRYWFGIIAASIFGTNLGDFYAHESGLGLGLGLLVLVGLFAITLVAEGKDRFAHEAYYWLAIIIIRTGATNIADYLAFRVRIPALLLTLGLVALMAVLAWSNATQRAGTSKDSATPALAKTNLTYWGAMLAAGVFGTVAGDICSHHFGQGLSAICLASMLPILLTVMKSRGAVSVGAYWCAVALARTAGTCIGDWLAENKMLHIGLPVSTLLTGTLFVAILLAWRSKDQEARAAA